MTILVGTTLCRFAMERGELWSSWLANAQAMRESTDERVEFFAAIELDALGLAPFSGLVTALESLALPGQEPYFTFTLDDGRTEVTTGNRLRHITMGQNLVTDYACSRPDVTHLLFMAADCMPAADAIPKLVELDWPIVGGHVSTYCLDGPLIPFGPHRPPDTDVREHMATAAFILLRRDLFTRLRWRWSLEGGMSDDPCMHHDALTLLGIPTYVRHDVLGYHYPECIPAIEQRGYDLTVTRAVQL
jgi:hypothetical protein